MVHLTFIHGIANKPSAEVLLEQWRVALLDNDGVDLDAMGASSSMVYWADLLYAEPLPASADLSAHQGLWLHVEDANGAFCRL